MIWAGIKFFPLFVYPENCFLFSTFTAWTQSPKPQMGGFASHKAVWEWHGIVTVKQHLSVKKNPKRNNPRIGW